MPKLTEATKQARQNQILQAALECFVETGYSATTMAQIIEKSGLSSGSIYSHFRGKEEILRGVISSNLAVVKDTYNPHQEVITPRQLAKDFSQRLDVTLGAKVMMAVWGEAPSSVKTAKIVLETFHEITDYLSSILEPWAAHKKPQGVDTADYAHRMAKVVMAVVHGIIIRLTMDQEINPQEFMEDAFAVLPDD